MTKSDLDKIKGIGPKTKEILLKNFESPEKIRTTPLSELEKLVGKSKAAILEKFFRKSALNFTSGAQAKLNDG